jgi:hypothetical protein
MRLFFIGLAVLAIIFFGIMGLGGKGNERPPSVADFRMPAVLESLGNLAFYYPWNSVTLPGTPFTVRLGKPVTVKVGPGSGTRLVKLQLVAGASAQIAYACGTGCETKTLCLVGANSPRPPGCEKASDRGTILLEPNGGEIRIAAGGFRPVRVVSR